MTQTPAQQVHQAFWQLPGAARKTIGASLMAEHAHPVMFELGRALVSKGSILPVLFIDNGLMDCRWNPEALDLAERLAEGADPWPVLGAAIQQTVRDRDAPPPDDMSIWPDEVADEDQLIYPPGDAE